MISVRAVELFANAPRYEGTYVRRAEACLLPWSLGIEEIERLLCIVGVREPFFSLSNPDAGIDPFNSWRFHDPHGFYADPRAVMREALRGTSTLIVRHAHLLIPEVRAWALALQNENLSVHANCYLTPPNSSGMPMHSDPRDTLLLQQHGSKHWQVRSLNDGAGLASPVQQTVNPAPLLDVTLNPGDVLFIPAGCYHQSTTGDAHSMHLTLGLRSLSVIAGEKPSQSWPCELRRIV
ncbi:JmjC domain-containing protein [Xanthobacter sp. AM11]|uniref:JmjC domain-containing protein n=1 Tax=Xanthobacter sp. AM11 TaxID=3380643 RepID=UPI0039BF5AD6